MAVGPYREALRFTTSTKCCDAAKSTAKSAGQQQQNAISPHKMARFSTPVKQENHSPLSPLLDSVFQTPRLSRVRGRISRSLGYKPAPQQLGVPATAAVLSLRGKEVGGENGAAAGGSHVLFVAISLMMSVDCTPQEPSRFSCCSTAVLYCPDSEPPYQAYL